MIAPLYGSSHRTPQWWRPIITAGLLIYQLFTNGLLFIKNIVDENTGHTVYTHSS